MILIYDINQVRKFHSLLKPLENDEVYFLSMSARNKYLTSEERIEYNLGRSEMMGRELVKTNDVNDYIRTIDSYTHPWVGRSHKELPPKCLMAYANINVSSSKKALKEFYTKANDLLFSLDTDPTATERLRHLDTLLNNCYQKSRGKRTWIDIDIDSPDKQFSLDQAMSLKEVYVSKGVEVHILDTHSGYHMLLKKDTIHFDYGLEVLRSDYYATERYEDKAEVIINNNDMVPIPGCYQGGYPVRILD